MARLGSTARVEHRVGYTARGQKLTLIGESDGKTEMSWSLRRDRAGPGQETVVIDGLTPATIRAMAEIVGRDAE